MPQTRPPDIRREARESLEHPGHLASDPWPTSGGQNEYRQPVAAQILLVTEALVGRDKNIELDLCTLQKLAVCEASPALLECVGDGTSREVGTQGYRSTLVQEDSHARFAAGLCGGEATGGMLEHRLNVLPANARKPFEELVDARPGFEVLEQSFDGNAGPLEEPDPADLLGHSFDGRALAPIEHRCQSTAMRERRQHSPTAELA